MYSLSSFDGFVVTDEERKATMEAIATNRGFLDQLDGEERFLILADMEGIMIKNAADRADYLNQETFDVRCEDAVEKFVDMMEDYRFPNTYLSIFVVFHRLVYKEHVCVICRPYLRYVWNARIFKESNNVANRVMSHQACENNNCHICHVFGVCGLLTKAGREIDLIDKMDISKYGRDQLDFICDAMAILINVIRCVVRDIYFCLSHKDYEASTKMISLGFFDQVSYVKGYEIAMIHLSECRFKKYDQLIVNKESGIVPDRCNHVINEDQFGKKCPVCGLNYSCARRVDRNRVVGLLIN